MARIRRGVRMLTGKASQRTHTTVRWANNAKQRKKQAQRWVSKSGPVTVTQTEPTMPPVTDEERRAARERAR